jgi:hypothetical protein
MRSIESLSPKNKEVKIDRNDVIMERGTKEPAANRRR